MKLSPRGQNVQKMVRLTSVMAWVGSAIVMRLRLLFIAWAIFIAGTGSAQTWESYIKHFPRKRSTIVRDYQGNILKTHSLGVLNVRVTPVQQCADAAIRLRAEYFYGRKEYGKIRFRLTCGLEVPFTKWAAGYRVKVVGNDAMLVAPRKRTKDYSRSNFERYLHTVMYYAGSASLYRDMQSVRGLPQIGDVLILPGYPGHVVIVIDKKVANNTHYYLFANSWIPAQDIEIISGTNPAKKNLGNYTPIRSAKDKVIINGYTFIVGKHLRRWR